MIFVYGDSHAQYTFAHPPPHLEFYIGINSIGGKTMYSVARDQVILDFNPESHREDSILAFCFGEIDCRCHIKKQSLQQKKSEQVVISDLITNYVNSVLKIVEASPSKIIIFVAVSPPVRKSAYADKSLFGEFAASDDERLRFTNQMNMLLHSLCMQIDVGGKKLLFFDPYRNNYVDSDGFMFFELSDKAIHIGEPKYVHDKLHATICDLVGADYINTLAVPHAFRQLQVFSSDSVLHRGQVEAVRFGFMKRCQKPMTRAEIIRTLRKASDACDAVGYPVQHVCDGIAISRWAIYYAHCAMEILKHILHKQLMYVSQQKRLRVCHITGKQNFAGLCVVMRSFCRMIIWTHIAESEKTQQMQTWYLETAQVPKHSAHSTTNWMEHDFGKYDLVLIDQDALQFSKPMYHAQFNNWHVLDTFDASWARSGHFIRPI